MPKQKQQAFSRYSREATVLLGKLIRQRRIEQGITVQRLADRAGISRGLVQRIERGDIGCSIGSVFETAAIVGVPLFDASLSELRVSAAATDKMLRLLPHAVYRPRKDVDDDF